MPRTKNSGAVHRHDPLQKQLHDDYVHSTYGKLSRPDRKRRPQSDEQPQSTLDEKASKKILALARQQQDEISDAESSSPSLPQPRLAATRALDEDVSDSDLEDRYDEDGYLEEVCSSPSRPDLYS